MNNQIERKPLSEKKQAKYLCKVRKKEEKVLKKLEKRKQKGKA